MSQLASLLTQAQAEGVELHMDPPDQLKLRGDRAAVERWTPILRPHKPALLAMLTRDQLLSLYREWLSGITEPRAVVTLDDAQVRQAVAAGVLTREQARASVLLVVRSPRGELGEGAVGMLAIPRAKYDGFQIMCALEALRWTH